MEKKEDDAKEKLKAMIASFVLTFIAALATKLVTMILANDSVDAVILYISKQYSFWFQLIVGSGTAAFVVRHFIGKQKL